MKLEGNNGNSFEIEVTNYEFPSETKDHHDSNWLIINVATLFDGYAWKSTGSYLCQFELNELANWISHETREGFLDFIEPNLSFEKEFNIETNQFSLKIFVQLETSPKENKLPFDEDKDSWFLELKCSKIIMDKFSEAIHKQLVDFPLRGPVVLESK